MELKRIDWQSDDYKEELFLRDVVLRKPLGLSIYDEVLDEEEGQIHFGLFDGPVILGCIVAVPISDTEVKFRQMAVSPKMQGKGCGKQVLKFAEVQLLEQGFNNVFMHARLAQSDFYLKQGYKKVGNEFTELGIPHIRMEKTLEQ